MGLETVREIAGRCLLAECSTAGLHLERSDCMCLYCTKSAHLILNLLVQTGTGSRYDCARETQVITTAVCEYSQYNTIQNL